VFYLITRSCANSSILGARQQFKPAKGQFQIYYKHGANHLEYQPDFVAEAKNAIYMLEPKASNQMCEFRSKLDTHSTANWTAIPAQTGH
jgi:type III restriction enzyme